VLRERVTSKGGTTERGIAALEAAAVRQAIAQAVEAASRRSAELGDELGRWHDRRCAKFHPDAGQPVVVAVLLRFMMQLFRVPANPFAQFIVAITDFAVKLRRCAGLFGSTGPAWCWRLARIRRRHAVLADGFPVLAGAEWPVMLAAAVRC
jgi:hypothetical protein